MQTNNTIPKIPKTPKRPITPKPLPSVEEKRNSIPHTRKLNHSENYDYDSDNDAENPELTAAEISFNSAPLPQRPNSTQQLRQDTKRPRSSKDSEIFQRHSPISPQLPTENLAKLNQENAT